MLLLKLLTASTPLAVVGTRLESLNVDPAAVVTVGLGNSADFAHQFHIAFAEMVSGSCLFSGQPFNCATSGFAGDTQEWKDKLAALNGSASSANDHCRSASSGELFSRPPISFKKLEFFPAFTWSCGKRRYNCEQYEAVKLDS